MAYERLVSAKWESLMYQAHNKQILNNYTLEEAWNMGQQMPKSGMPPKQ